MQGERTRLTPKRTEDALKGLLKRLTENLMHGIVRIELPESSTDIDGGENIPLPHERHGREMHPHEELRELIERKFRELNERLDEIEARLGK